jgi:hypothetical protein
MPTLAGTFLVALMENAIAGECAATPPFSSGK